MSINETYNTTKKDNFRRPIRDWFFEKICLNNISSSPIKPADGTIVYSDGISWDPGDGIGIYAYFNNTWNYLSGGGGGSGVISFNGRTGTVVPLTNDYTWAQINKATSSIADITTKSHTLLTDIGVNTHTQIDTFINTTVPATYLKLYGSNDPITGAITINTNSATALLVEQDGVKDDVFIVDTTNKRVGVGIAPTNGLFETGGDAGSDRINYFAGTSTHNIPIIFNPTCNWTDASAANFATHAFTAIIQPQDAITKNIWNFLTNVQVSNSSFNIAQLYGYSSNLQLMDTYSGTVANATMFNISNPSLGAGGASITTLIGLNIANMNTGTTNYSIYTGTGIHRWGGQFLMANGLFYPTANSTTAFQFNKADGTTNVLNIDTTNSRVGIGTTSPSVKLHIVGQGYFNVNSTTALLVEQDGVKDDVLTVDTTNAKVKFGSSASAQASFDYYASSDATLYSQSSFGWGNQCSMDGTGGGGQNLFIRTGGTIASQTAVLVNMTLEIGRAHV